MKMLVKLVDRLVDMEAVEAMADYGDYVHLQFGVFSDPPHIFLRGQRAEAFREWFRNTHGCDDETRDLCTRISGDRLRQLETRIKSGESLTAAESLELVAALRTMTLDRDSLIQLESRTNWWFLTEPDRLAREVESDTIIRPVKCLIADGCRINSDGSCDHTPDDQTACWFWNGPEEWNVNNGA